MNIHKLYGPSIQDAGWVPSPTYLMRRSRILRHISTLQPGSVLEIGCGAGALLLELDRLGFDCTALETSDAARNIAIALHERSGARIVGAPDPDWNLHFDYVVAFEVLEHIEDDAAALAQWHQWMRPGATLLLSVPAHQYKWNASDVWAGHYRRYARRDLVLLLQSSGFVVEHVEMYGSPLNLVIDPLRSIMHSRQQRRRKINNTDTVANNSSRSGIERSGESKLYPLLCSLPGRTLMRSAFFMQPALGRLGFGNGFLLQAKKSARLQIDNPERSRA